VKKLSKKKLAKQLQERATEEKRIHAKLMEERIRDLKKKRAQQKLKSAINKSENENTGSGDITEPSSNVNDNDDDYDDDDDDDDDKEEEEGEMDSEYARTIFQVIFPYVTTSLMNMFYTTTRIETTDICLNQLEKYLYLCCILGLEDERDCIVFSMVQASGLVSSTSTSITNNIGIIEKKNIEAIKSVIKLSRPNSCGNVLRKSWKHVIVLLANLQLLYQVNENLSSQDAELAYFSSPVSNAPILRPALPQISTDTDTSYNIDSLLRNPFSTPRNAVYLFRICNFPLSNVNLIFQNSALLFPSSLGFLISSLCWMNELYCNVPPDYHINLIYKMNVKVTKKTKTISHFTSSIDQVYKTRHDPWMYSIFKLLDVVEKNINKDVKVWDFLFPPLSKHLQEIGLNSINENIRLVSVMIFRTLIASVLKREEFEKGSFSYPFGGEGEVEEGENDETEIPTGEDHTSSDKSPITAVSPSPSINPQPSPSPVLSDLNLSLKNISTSISTSLGSAHYNRHKTFLSIGLDLLRLW
jgi:hypothetical protein